MDVNAEKRSGVKSFLIILAGLAVIILLGIFSIEMSWLPGSRASVETQLQRQAEIALTATRAGWATVEMDGQKAFLSGEAPDQAALNSAAFALARTTGGRGRIFGGVTEVDFSRATIAAAEASPIAPKQPSADQSHTVENIVAVDETDAATISESIGALEAPEADPDDDAVDVANLRDLPARIDLSRSGGADDETGDEPTRVEPAASDEALQEPSVADPVSADGAPPPDEQAGEQAAVEQPSLVVPSTPSLAPNLEGQTERADAAPALQTSNETQDPSPDSAAIPASSASPECRNRILTIVDNFDISFQSAGAIMLSASEEALRELATVLLVCPQTRLEIIGHTDASGPEENNRRLSLERARAVAVSLRGYGVANAQLTPRGAGSSEPVADNATPEGRAQNRRIEFRLAPNREP